MPGPMIQTSKKPTSGDVISAGAQVMAVPEMALSGKAVQQALIRNAAGDFETMVKLPGSVWTPLERMRSTIGEAGWDRIMRAVNEAKEIMPTGASWTREVGRRGRVRLLEMLKGE